MAGSNTKNASGPKWTSVSKAAAVMIALGANNAAKVYSHLNEEEVEMLSIEIAKLKKIDPDKMKEVVDDFYGLCVTQKIITEDGALYAQMVLEKAFGSDKAASYMQRVSVAMKTRAFEFIRKANYKNLMIMLQNEHPQTIAFVLSYAKAEQTSKIIAELPKDIQFDVIRRIATIYSVSPEIVGIIEKVLEKRFSAVVAVDMTEIGGINYVADIMNHTDRTTEKYIFDELGKHEPELTEEIRKLMFVFEDIIKLDDMAVQRVLRDVDVRQLAIAIKGSNEEVKNMLLGNVSARARESILEDIQYLRNVRLKDVEEAQQNIVNIIRALEETGEIVVSRGGEDDVIIA